MLKESIRQNRIHVSSHASREMEDDEIGMGDLTAALLWGTLVKLSTSRKYLPD